jgi:hypothetical protein
MKSARQASNARAKDVARVSRFEFHENAFFCDTMPYAAVILSKLERSRAAGA